MRGHAEAWWTLSVIKDLPTTRYIFFQSECLKLLEALCIKNPEVQGGRRKQGTNHIGLPYLYKLKEFWHTLTRVLLSCGWLALRFVHRIPALRFPEQPPRTYQTNMLCVVICVFFFIVCEFVGFERITQICRRLLQLSPGRAPFVAIQQTVIHIYIYIYIERERER